VLEALAHGADTVLLMVSILPQTRLRALVACCRARGLEPLVEVVTPAELKVALDAGARVLGVNNRNLHTFELDKGRTAQIARELRETFKVPCGPGGAVRLLALAQCCQLSMAGCRPCLKEGHWAEAAAAAESKVKTMPGVLPPLGFWDPWGLSTNAGDDTIAFYREAELKHGRVCMLASLGIIVGEKFHPFNGGAEVDILGMPIESTPYTSFFSSVVLALIGFAELKSAARLQGLMTGDSKFVAGDLGFDPLGIKPKKESEFLELQNKEISNGRLAMLAVAGAIAQEQVTLQKIFR